MSDNMNNSLKQTNSTESVKSYSEASMQQLLISAIEKQTEETHEVKETLIEIQVENIERNKELTRKIDELEYKVAQIEKDKEKGSSLLVIFAVIVIAIILALFLYIMTNGKVI